MTAAPDAKKPGRPRKYADKRPTLTIRLQAAFRDQIAAIGEKSGMSISEVCEQRIAASLSEDRPSDIELIRTTAETLRGVGWAFGRRDAVGAMNDILRRYGFTMARCLPCSGSGFEKHDVAQSWSRKTVEKRMPCTFCQGAGLVSLNGSVAS